MVKQMKEQTEPAAGELSCLVSGSWSAAASSPSPLAAGMCYLLVSLALCVKVFVCLLYFWLAQIRLGSFCSAGAQWYLWVRNLKRSVSPSCVGASLMSVNTLKPLIGPTLNYILVCNVTDGVYITVFSQHYSKVKYWFFCSRWDELCPVVLWLLYQGLLCLH